MISLPVRLTGAKCAAIALAISSLSPALFAQDLVREIDFVRALAKELKFIELARNWPVWVLQTHYALHSGRFSDQAVDSQHTSDET